MTARIFQCRWLLPAIFLLFSTAIRGSCVPPLAHLEVKLPADLSMYGSRTGPAPFPSC